jgi:fructose-specific phosphotransferase system IIC component
MRDFLILCVSRSIVRRAGFTALMVGTVLIIINHGDVLLTGQVDASRLFKMILTVLVPYIVSTVSSVSTIRSMRREQAELNRAASAER